MLYYHDFATGKSVPVCDRTECDHQAVDPDSGTSATCNAQIKTYNTVAVYQDKIYYVEQAERYLSLRRRDTDGNNDEKVADLDAAQMGGRMWFYRDRAFLMASTDVSGSFDAETRKSDKSRMRLFVINLTNGKTEILAESSLIAAVNYAFNVYRMEDGKAYYYDLERDKWYVYDIDSGTRTEQDEIRKHAKYGSLGEYVDMYGDYCYELFTDDSGNSRIMRLDWETGEENIIYEGNDGNVVTFTIWEMDCMLISELTQDISKIKNLIWYDMISGELKPIPDSFYEDYRVYHPYDGSGKGIIYTYAVDKEEGDQPYDGDIEYRFMSLEDLLEGTGEYQVVY